MSALIPYVTFFKSLNESATDLSQLKPEFDILKQEIKHINSSNSTKLLEILETEGNLFDILNSNNESIITTISDIIKKLINLEINQLDDLNLVRIFLIIFFSIFVRACKSNETEITKLDASLYKKLKDIFTEIYKLIEGSHLQDCFSPLLFLIGVICRSIPHVSDEKYDERISTNLRKLLQIFPIFDTIRIKWLKRSYQIFSDNSYKIFNHTIFFALEIFFYNLIFPKKSDKLDKKSVFPLLIYIFKHQSSNDTLDKYFFKNFIMEKSIKVLFDRFNPFLILLTSRLIKSSEIANQVWNELNEKKFETFMEYLQKSLNELTVNDNDTYEYDIDKNKYLNAIQLLYKLSKYLEIPKFEELVIKCFNVRSTGIDPDLPNDTEYKEFSCFISFVYFITDFLWKPKYNIYAAKILEQLTRKYPLFMAGYYDSLFENHFSDVVKIIDDSSNDHRLIIAFLKASAHFIYYHFSYQPPIQELPIFVKYFIFDFFPSAVYRKYKSQKAQWKVFTELIKTANDLILTDYSSLLLVHEDEKFLPSLITLINYAAKNIYVTFRSKKNSDSSNKKEIKPKDTTGKKVDDSNDSDDESDDESEVSQLSYKDSAYQLTFERDALELLHNLLSIHILRNEQPTHLYNELFNDQWISKLITSLTKFLNLEAPKELPKEIYIKLRDLRSLSLNIFELLCNACYKIGNDSFEVYYPRKYQKIYINIIYGTLCNTKNEYEVARIVDFASAIIETQKTFAYSLVRHSYFSLIIQALNQFDGGKNKRNGYWEVMASLSKLISKLFINLDTNADIIKLLMFPERSDPKIIKTQSSKPIGDNPTSGLTRPSTNCKSLSQSWCNVIDFIFDKDINKVINHENKILVMARLLKSIICIFLYINCQSPAEEFIRNFLDNIFQQLFKKEKDDNFIIKTNKDINLNDFKSYIMYPRPDEYYIDVCKLNWCMNNRDKKLIENVKQLNQRLFLIHCKTELVSSVHSFIHFLLIDDITNFDFGKIDKKNLLNFICDVLKINYLPITTVETVFKLFETIIMHPKMQDTGYPIESVQEIIRAARDFLKESPNSIVFRVITKLLELTNDTESNKLNEDNVLVDLFYIACKAISTEDPDENATSLIIETSLKVSHVPSILEGENTILYLSFYKNVLKNHATNIKFAIHALKATRVLCRYKYSTENLEKVGFFDYLISSIEPGQNSLTKDSKLWPHIFSIFLSLPPNSHITADFVCKSFPYIAFFLNEKLASKEYGEKLQSEPDKKKEDIHLIRTQESIICLIAHISKNISLLSSRNPSITQALEELVFIQFELSFKILHNVSKDKEIKFKNILLIELHDIPTSSILILHSCLLILNNLATYPYLSLPKGFRKANSYQEIMSWLAGTIEDIYAIFPKVIGKDFNESDPRLSYSNIIFRSAGLAARLFSGLCTSILSDENISKDEKKKGKDNCSRFISALTKITEYQLPDDLKSNLDIATLSTFLENVKELTS